VAIHKSNASSRALLAQRLAMSSLVRPQTQIHGAKRLPASSATPKPRRRELLGNRFPALFFVAQHKKVFENT
jgi:hypothetical protein